MKNITVLLVATGLIMIAIFLQRSGTKTEPLPRPDYQNISYKIDGQQILLTKGVAENELAPGSAAKKITRYFGNLAEGDLNSDDKNDVGLILTQENGGSGIFYYAVVATKTNQGYAGSNAIFLGDRISPQSTSINNNVLIVNYADRDINEPMTTNPSIGKSKYLEIRNGILSEAPIFVESPEKNSTLVSPLNISGVAKGSWFFEASFPLLLVDEQGKILAQSHATAKGKWMTPDYVGFSGTLTFAEPTQETKARLILKKDNPSGLAEHDDAREIPVWLR